MDVKGLTISHVKSHLQVCFFLTGLIKPIFFFVYIYFLLSQCFSIISLFWLHSFISFFWQTRCTEVWEVTWADKVLNKRALFCQTVLCFFHTFFHTAFCFDFSVYISSACNLCCTLNNITLCSLKTLSIVVSHIGTYLKLKDKACDAQVWEICSCNIFHLLYTLWHLGYAKIDEKELSAKVLLDLLLMEFFMKPT